MNKKIRFFQSIHFKIAIVFILLLVVTLELIGAYFVKTLEQQNIEQFKTSVNVDSYIQDKLAADLLRTDTDNANDDIKSTLSQADIANSADLQVIDAKGTIRGDSDINAQTNVGQKSANSNIKNTLYSGQQYEGYEYRERTGSTYYKVVPIKNPNATGDNNSVIGAIAISASMEQAYDSINKIVGIFLISSLVAGLLGTLLSIVISRAITRPIDEMKKQAIRMARGDYSGQVRIYGQDELGQLAVAVNNLSVRVEEAQEASEAERRRLDSVLAHMTDGVIATDRRGNVIIINQTALSFLNTKNEDVIGVSILKLLNIAKDYTLRDLLEHQTELLLDFSEQLDHDLILRVDFSLIQRETGFISGLVAVLHDVTEQQKIDRDRKEFVSNVSHELKTPLTSMKVLADSLNMQTDAPVELYREFMQDIGEEIDRENIIINDLLSLVKMDKTEADLNIASVAINDLLESILKRLKPIASKRNIELVLESYRPVTAECDEVKLTLALSNLVENAIKYNVAGGWVQVTLDADHKFFYVTVDDSGIGIPEEYQDKIFERFYRVDKARSRETGGTGLGLSITKNIIQMHHGAIKVASKEDEGTTFSVRIPLTYIKQ